MYFRCTVSTCILFSFLCIAVVGCNQPDKVVDQGLPPIIQQNTDDPGVHYERLLRKRLELQEKIFEAMELYRTTSEVVHEQRTLLMQILGKQPDSETVELFSKGQVRDIPQNLRAAYSCWRTQIPLRTRQAIIAKWLDDRQVAGELETFDIAITDVENREQLGRFYSQEELDKIDQLLAQQVVSLDAVEVANSALFEEEVIQQMISELKNWE